MTDAGTRNGTKNRRSTSYQSVQCHTDHGPYVRVIVRQQPDGWISRMSPDLHRPGRTDRASPAMAPRVQDRSEGPGQGRQDGDADVSAREGTDNRPPRRRARQPRRSARRSAARTRSRSHYAQPVRPPAPFDHDQPRVGTSTTGRPATLALSTRSSVTDARCETIGRSTSATTSSAGVRRSCAARASRRVFVR